jgi:hypothetical protein
LAQRPSKGVAALYHRKLQDIKMEKGETIMQFYGRFRSIVAILDIGKQPPSDFTQREQFLKALPQDFGNIRDFLLGDNQVTTVEQCLERLVTKESSLTASPSRAPGSAFPFQKRPHHGKPSAPSRTPSAPRQPGTSGGNRPNFGNNPNKGKQDL